MLWRRVQLKVLGTVKYKLDTIQVYRVIHAIGTSYSFEMVEDKKELH